MTDLSHDAPDDGFHEIQLSGKQLVFLFMATTVVSVVIFLCGVLVGRGVRGEPLTADSAPAPLSTGGASVSASPSTPPPPIVDSTTPAADKPLSYNRRLESENPVAEAVKAPAAEVAPATTRQPVTKPATEPTTEPVTEKAPQNAGVAKAQPGVWAVQVVALTDRAAATAVVQRLSNKGYPAFLVQPRSSTAGQNYKVQVGRFEDRSQAEQIAGRLKKEEQFQPWILR